VLVLAEKPLIVDTRLLVAVPHTALILPPGAPLKLLPLPVGGLNEDKPIRRLALLLTKLMATFFAVCRRKLLGISPVVKLRPLLPVVVA
jgi:hypothetical protein